MIKEVLFISELFSRREYNMGLEYGCIFLNYFTDVITIWVQGMIIAVFFNPVLFSRREYNMGPENLAHHLEVMEELVRRDKNRPSALIWSVANEPRSWFASSRDYFG